VEVTIVIGAGVPVDGGMYQPAYEDIMANIETIAFRMNLNPGRKAEYKRRHDEIWPELSRLLRDAGVSDYSIWLDEETNHLFAVLKRPADHGTDDLPKQAIMRKWWDYMADVMETDAANTPVSIGLEKMFHME
jgi:L-rhamnose mutarotase